MKRNVITFLCGLAGMIVAAGGIWLVRDYMAYRTQLDNVVQWIVNQQKAAQQAQQPKPQNYVEKKQ